MNTEAKPATPPKYRAEIRADNDAAAGWSVVSEDGLLCMYCSQSEAEMIARACNSHDALITALGNAAHRIRWLVQFASNIDKAQIEEELRLWSMLADSADALKVPR
jgi:hypothetical protein